MGLSSEILATKNASTFPIPTSSALDAAGESTDADSSPVVGVVDGAPGCIGSWYTLAGLEEGLKTDNSVGLFSSFHSPLLPLPAAPSTIAGASPPDLVLNYSCKNLTYKFCQEINLNLKCLPFCPILATLIMVWKNTAFISLTFVVESGSLFLLYHPL